MVVKVGNAVVKIYRIKHKTTASGFAYAVATRGADGKRHLSQFADLADATEEARLKAGQLNAGRVEGAEMTRSDRDELQAAKAITGAVPLLSALEEWRKARELTAGHTLTACEAWAARNGTAFESVTLTEASKRFLAAKTASGVSVKKSYGRVFPELLKVFGERTIATLDAKELQAWMEKRFPHPVTRNTVRKRCVSLWRWARKKNYLPRDVQSEAELIDTAQEPHLEIGIIDAATFARLLHFFREKHSQYLGALALAGFAGLRRSELHAQAWEDVNLEAGHLKVTAAKANTPAKRLIPLSPAAVQWLLLCANRKGLVSFNAEIHRVNLAMDRIRDIAQAAKDDAGEPLFPPLPENCFRHACISHRVAQTGNVAETSLEMGNSAKIIFAHYRALVTKAEGEKWFTIPTEPAKPAEVIDMKAANE